MADSLRRNIQPFDNKSFILGLIFLKYKSNCFEEVGQTIDDTMIVIERENRSPKGVLRKNYAMPEIDKTKHGELIALFSFNTGSKESKTQNILNRVHEYFLGKYSPSHEEFYPKSPRKV